jgi:hypothetical protein
MIRIQVSPSFFFLVIAALLAAAGLWLRMKFQETAKWPKTVATVESIELIPSSKYRSSKEYKMAFTYEIDGNLFRSETIVGGKRAWETIRPGAEIEAAYDPKDFGTVFIFASAGTFHHFLFIAGFICAGLAILVIVVKRLKGGADRS